MNAARHNIQGAGLERVASVWRGGGGPGDRWAEGYSNHSVAQKILARPTHVRSARG